MINLVQRVIELAQAIAVDIKSLYLTKSDKDHTHTPEQVGLGNVDNTSDEDKPMGRAHRAAMATKFNTSSVSQTTGSDNFRVMSQKASTESFFGIGSGVTRAGKIHVGSVAPSVDVEEGDIWLKI